MGGTHIMLSVQLLHVSTSGLLKTPPFQGRPLLVVGGGVLTGLPTPPAPRTPETHSRKGSQSFRRHANCSAPLTSSASLAALLACPTLRLMTTFSDLAQERVRLTTGKVIRRVLG